MTINFPKLIKGNDGFEFEGEDFYTKESVEAWASKLAETIVCEGRGCPYNDGLTFDQEALAKQHPERICGSCLAQIECKRIASGT